jgi:large subunit ribosomal protein L4
MQDHKTKSVAGALKTLEVQKTVLLVDNGENVNLARGTRNLQGVKLVASKDVNVYDLLGHERVLLSEAAARKLSEALA